MPRDFDQIMRSKETDSWAKQWHGLNGTTVGGTVALSIAPISGRTIQYVTDIAFTTTSGGATLEILNGTAFLFFVFPPLAYISFTQRLATPLKTSEGTSLNINLYSTNFVGTVSLNIGGYTVK